MSHEMSHKTSHETREWPERVGRGHVRLDRERDRMVASQGAVESTARGTTAIRRYIHHGDVSLQSDATRTRRGGFRPDQARDAVSLRACWGQVGLSH